jgi:hypothetical protein
MFSIKLDQKTSQDMFKPGGHLKIIMSKEIIYGFLFKWNPGETHFLILQTHNGKLSIKKIDYFKCQEVWYSNKNEFEFKKAIIELQSGTRKIKKPITPADSDYIKHLLSKINSLAS